MQEKLEESIKRDEPVNSDSEEEKSEDDE